jgi:hypothetical protein
LDVLKNSFVTRTTMTKPLSSAAQAVLDAAADVYWDWSDMSPASSSIIAAAALRAAAAYCNRDTLIILALANELEGGND